MKKSYRPFCIFLIFLQTPFLFLKIHFLFLIQSSLFVYFLCCFKFHSEVSFHSLVNEKWLYRTFSTKPQCNFINFSWFLLSLLKKNFLISETMIIINKVYNTSKNPWKIDPENLFCHIFQFDQYCSSLIRTVPVWPGLFQFEGYQNLYKKM